MARFRALAESRHLKILFTWITRTLPFSQDPERPSHNGAVFLENLQLEVVQENAVGITFVSFSGTYHFSHGFPSLLFISLQIIELEIYVAVNPFRDGLQVPGSPEMRVINKSVTTVFYSVS